MPAQRPHYRVTYAVVLVGVAAYALLQSLVVPVLPTIERSLHTSQDAVTWVLTSYLLSASVFTPILGRIGDMVGKERMLVLALGALALGSLLAALASSIGLMVVARAVQGVGGGVLPLAFGIVRDEFPPERVRGAIGAIAALVAVGGGLGIVLAGPLVDLLDVHWLFWLPLIVVSLATVGAQLFVPESPVRTAGRINLSGGILLSAWLVALLLGVSEGPTWGWTSAGVLGLLAGAAVGLVAWIGAESRSDHPLIDLQMMRVPAVWTTNLVALLFGAGMYSVFAFLPAFVQTPRRAGYGFGASVTQSGLYLLPMCALMFFAGLGSGSLARRFGSKAVLVVASVLSLVALGLLTARDSAEWAVYVSMAILGIGIGFALSAMSNVIVESVPASQTGVASGMNANIRTIGGSIGAGVMASVVTSGASADGLPRLVGYTHGFAMLTGATLLAAIASLLIPRLREGREGPDLGEALETELVGGLAGSEAE